LAKNVSIGNCGVAGDVKILLHLHENAMENCDAQFPANCAGRSLVASVKMR
jgi:hypothetical protein